MAEHATVCLNQGHSATYDFLTCGGGGAPSAQNRPISLPNLTSVLPQIITTNCDESGGQNSCSSFYDDDTSDKMSSCCTSDLNLVTCCSASGQGVSGSCHRLRSGSSTSDTMPQHHHLFNTEQDASRRHSCCSCLCESSAASSVVSEEEHPGSSDKTTPGSVLCWFNIPPVNL